MIPPLQSNRSRLLRMYRLHRYYWENGTGPLPSYSIHLALMGFGLITRASSNRTYGSAVRLSSFQPVRLPTWLNLRMSSLITTHGGQAFVLRAVRRLYYFQWSYSAFHISMYGVLHGVCSCPATPYCQVLTLIVKAILAAYGVLHTHAHATA